MIKFLIDLINQYVYLGNGLSIESITHFDNKKVSVVLSFFDTKMVSIELLTTGVCDILVIEIESENILKSETFSFKNKEDLKEEILLVMESL